MNRNSVREITVSKALNEALREEMERDDRIIVMGEDVALMGGVRKVTEGLLDEFGPERVIDTPISEEGFLGASVGAAISGCKVVVEIMYADFLYCCANQIINNAAKLRYVTGGQLKVPIVIRTSLGVPEKGCGPNHSQITVPTFMNIPGLRIVTYSNPYDAKGLLKTAIREENPTIFFEPGLLYAKEGAVPEEPYTVPFSKAKIMREGKDLTIITMCDMVYTALTAASRLESERIDVEVIDLRTLAPMDKETVIESIEKTNKLITVEPSCKTSGIGSEIAAFVAQDAFDYLAAPIIRVAAPDVPIPVSPPLAKQITPSEQDIIQAVKSIT